MLCPPSGSVQTRPQNGGCVIVGIYVEGRLLTSGRSLLRNSDLDRVKLIFNST